MRSRGLLMALLGLALVLASCGGGGEVSENEIGDGDAQEQGSESDANDGSEGDTAIPELDPSSAPPPGEARIEVDGQVFDLSETGMEHFACEIRDDGVSVNFQSGSQSPLFLQGATQPDGSLLVSVTVRLEDEGVRYDSTNGGGRSGGAVTDGAKLLYVGEFDATPLEDPTSIDSVGEGSVWVTCP